MLSHQLHHVWISTLLLLLVPLIIGACQRSAPPTGVGGALNVVSLGPPATPSATISQVLPQARPTSVASPTQIIPPYLIATDVANGVTPVHGTTAELAVNLYTLSVVSLAGGSPRSLGVHTSSFAWSPSGQSIAYTEGSDLRVLDLKTGNSVSLITMRDRVGSSPRWSPNGELIAFYSQPVPIGSGYNEIGLIGKDGTNYRIFDDRPIEGFSWAPDSRRIVYATEGQLYVYDSSQDKSQPLILTDYGLSGLYACSPAWSVQQELMAIFIFKRPSLEDKVSWKGYAILNMMNYQVTFLKSYAMIETVPYEGIPTREHIGGCDQPPALWDPKGESLLLTIFPVPRTNLGGSFWLVDTQTQQERQLDGAYGAYAADWSPDGHWITYINLGDHSLRVVDSVDLQEQVVMGENCCEGVAWRPQSR